MVYFLSILFMCDYRGFFISKIVGFFSSDEASNKLYQLSQHLGQIHNLLPWDWVTNNVLIRSFYHLLALQRKGSRRIFSSRNNPRNCRLFLTAHCYIYSGHSRGRNSASQKKKITNDVTPCTQTISERKEFHFFPLI